mmetsp:Transcript_2624/g.5706  ORF Transcript_2624/g.5706 Transcript_2624/m.5706 type:complete len:118 (-) Transcript_2624:2108-2461(-)
MDKAQRKQQLVGKVADRAQRKCGGRALCCPEDVWTRYATLISLGFLKRDPTDIPDEDIDFMADVVGEAVLEACKSSSSSVGLPGVCPLSASSTDKPADASHKRKYEQTTLAEKRQLG